MTLLYGKDSNGNQVPLLVDATGVVQTTGGGTGVTTAFDCDFTLLSNLSITGATSITDQASRSLTFTPANAGTASIAIVNGSGLGFTTASNGGRARLFTPFSGFSRNAFFGYGYRIWMRWANYTPLASTSGLFTGCYVEPSAGASINLVENYRQNNVSFYSNTGPDGTYNLFFPQATSSYNVFVLEQTAGMMTTYYGTSASGFPALSSLRVLTSGRSRALSSTYWFNVDLSGYGYEMQFANLTDSTSRTMYCTNLLVETWL
jgi:hypothetical protein